MIERNKDLDKFPDFFHAMRRGVLGSQEVLAKFYKFFLGGGVVLNHQFIFKKWVNPVKG